MRTRHSPLFLLAPLTVVLAIAGFTLIAAPAASAKKATPQVTKLKIYRTPSGPEKGALTVIAMLNYRGFAKITDSPNGQTPPLTRAIVTLTGANHTIIARDSVRLHLHAFKGAAVRFDFRIPASRARKIDDAKLKVGLVVKLRNRTATLSSNRRGTTPATRQFACFIWCPVNSAPPPAPTVAFGIASENPVICLGFNDSGYAQPYLFEVAYFDAAGNAIFGGGSSAFDVSSSGSFSDVGVEQPASGGAGDVIVTFSGSVPSSVLSAPPNASTGNAVLAYTGPPFGQIPNPMILPYQPNSAAGC